jgi:transposase
VAHGPGAAIRVLNRLELVAETLRAALNELATVAPNWLRSIAPVQWYERYGQRIEEARLRKAETKRHAYAQTVGADGFHVLDALEAPEAPAELRALPIIETLHWTWQRHYERSPAAGLAQGSPPGSRVRFKANRELPRAAEGIDSPYGPEARDHNTRDTQWTGYLVHVSETCEPLAPRLLTHVYTTPVTVYEAQCTAPIQQALVDKDVPPQEHLVDYVL